MGGKTWLALALALAGCGIGAEGQSATVSMALPLLDCGALQDPARGGSPMEGTFIAIVGAEFPPITELRRGQNPCAGGASSGEDVANLTVRVPAGDKRALALALVGPALDLPSVVDVTLVGASFQTRQPRPVFFGGGVILRRDDLAAASPHVTLDLEPFVNVVGRARRDGNGVDTLVKFFLPEAEGCLKILDTEEDPAIKEVFQLRTGGDGVFFASAPYRATNAGCNTDRIQGNEVFAWAEGGGGVALFVPGRAETPGSGLEPGVLLKNAALYLRPLSHDAASFVTSVTLIPTSDSVKLHVTGYGVPDVGNGTRTFPVRKLAGGGTEDVEFSLSHPVVIGRVFDTVKMRSYDRFRVFGEREPFSMSLESTQGFPAGAYEITLADGTVFAFRVGAQ